MNYLTSFSSPPVENSQLLREINFGKEEGVFFDGLSSEEKDRFNDENIRFKEGESWADVKYRALKYFSVFSADKPSLIVTHGGFIYALLKGKNVEEQVLSGSAVGLTFTKPESLSLLSKYKYLKSEDQAQFNQEFDHELQKIVEIEFIYDIPNLED